jgi:hypothetical protein
MPRRRLRWLVASAGILALALWATTSPADDPSSSPKAPDPVASATAGNSSTPGGSNSAAAQKTAKTPQKVAKSVKAKKKNRRKIVSKTKYDPNAAHVDLFDGMGDGSISVKVVAEDSSGGNLYVQNQSNQPLTVEMPDSFVVQQIARQFGGGGGGAGGRGGTAGGAQAAGGGAGGGGGMGGGVGGGGMFSVPPDTTLRVPYQSVCLEHGKADPDPTIHYQVIPVSQYTQDPQLAALLSLVGTQKIDHAVAQAAAWHLANKMSWDELAAKRSTEIGFEAYAYFTPEALFKAQGLAAEAGGLARERALHPQVKAAKKEKHKDTPKSAHDQVIKGS